MFGFQKGKIRSRLFLSWIASYFLILLLPLILCAPVFWGLKENVRQELYQSREAALWQFSQVFEQRLGDVENLALQISMLSELNAIKRSSSTMTAEDIYNYYLLQQQLEEKRKVQSFVQQIYFYTSKADVLLSEGYLYHPEDISDSRDTTESLLLRDYVNRLDEYTAPTFLVDIRSNRFGMSLSYLLYIYPMHTGTSSDKGDAIFIVINTQELQSILTSSLYDRGGSFYIADENIALPLNGTMPYPKNLDFSRLIEEGTVEFSENDVAYTAISLPEEEHHWRYIHVFENDLVQETTKGYMLLYIACLSVSILAGCILSYLFARRNYHPVQALGEMFKTDRTHTVTPPSTGTEAERDEMGYIIRQVQDLQERSLEAQQQLARQEEQLREAILVRALRGEISVAQQERDLIANGFTLDEVVCMVILVVFPSPESQWKDGDPEQLFSNVLLQEGLTAYTVQVEPGTCAVLLTMPQSVEDNVERMQNAVQRLNVCIRRKYPGSICGCSSAHADLQKLSSAYAEAEMVLNYNRAGDHAAVLFYQEKFRLGDLQRIAAADYAYLSCVRLRNFEGAQNCLEQVLEVQKDVGVALSPFRLSGLVNLMLATAAETVPQFRGAERQEMDSLVEELLHCKTVSEVEIAAQRIFQLISNSEHTGDDQRRSSAELFKSAKEYIEEHYSNVNLSVTMVADAIGISASYLTQLFKKFEGHSTADNIHLTRLAHAKTLLADHLIRDVAEQVGYQDVRSLIRVFKKYEGKTPSRFRDADANSEKTDSVNEEE